MFETMFLTLAAVAEPSSTPALAEPSHAAMTFGQFLLALIAIFAAAKLFGELAERIGQPAVLGEMLGGVVIGVSGLHLIDPHSNVIHLLSELGVLLLLFLIGLETDINKLISVGGSSLSVAAAGVILPFAGGYAAARALGLPNVVAIFLGASLTATSVGITARVLSDLGHLQDRESQIVLGAAVVDDIVGLVILTVVGSMAAGNAITVGSITKTTLIAFGFVLAAIIIGSKLAPTLIRIIVRLRVAKALFFASVMFAFGLAWLAAEVGSAVIIGAFAAGLVLSKTEKGRQIEHEVHDIAQFFIPIFFVMVGAAIDVKTMNPLNPETRGFFVVGLVLSVVGVVGKVLAGFAVSGKGTRRLLIGVGMVPRGEVGLIFAQIGLASGLLTAGLYSSVAMMVMVTTVMTPPLLRRMLTALPTDERRRPATYVMDAFEDQAREDEEAAARPGEPPG